MWPRATRPTSIAWKAKSRQSPGHGSVMLSCHRKSCNSCMVMCHCYNTREQVAQGLHVDFLSSMTGLKLTWKYEYQNLSACFTFICRSDLPLHLLGFLLSSFSVPASTATHYDYCIQSPTQVANKEKYSTRTTALGQAKDLPKLFPTSESGQQQFPRNSNKKRLWIGLYSL